MEKEAHRHTQKKNIWNKEASLIFGTVKLGNTQSKNEIIKNQQKSPDLTKEQKSLVSIDQSQTSQTKSPEKLV